ILVSTSVTISARYAPRVPGIFSPWTRHSRMWSRPFCGFSTPCPRTTGSGSPNRPQARQPTLDGGKRLLLRESRVQPLLLVVEDLHWIDGESQSVLDSMVESLPAAPVLLLVNYRPEYGHAWSGKSYYRQLGIE